MDFSKYLDTIKTAAMNPFGLNFVKHKGQFAIPVGSALNCLGYNDYLERVIGIARAAIGILVIATSQNLKEKVIAAGHITRGIMEMNGSFEAYLLVLDCIFTVYNIGNNIFRDKTKQTVVIAP